MVSSLAQQMFPNIRSEQERILRALNSGDPSEFTGYLRRLTQEESGWDELQARVPGSDRYLSFKPILRSPHAKLTASPRIPGLDGRKMSKSYGNAIMLTESDADIRAKTKVMVTDPARKRRSDPGNPDVCPVYDWHKLFSPPETLKWSAEGCRTAGIGCIECKAAMADNLIKWIAPIRERRLHYQGQEKLVRRFIQEGSVQARIVAQQTMVRVRDAVFGKDRVRRRNLRPLIKHQAG